MIIKSLKINNILSISDIEINFNTSGLVLLEGWNYDENRSNASGKTSIFNALCFALYGNVPRNVFKSEIMRKGQKKSYAICEIELGTDIYSVERHIPTNLIFKKNNEVLNINQEEFESILQMNYDQFLITMYVAQNSDSRFLSLNDTDKKDFILNLMKLEKFNDYQLECRNKIIEIDRVNHKYKTDIDSLESNVDFLKNQCDLIDLFKKQIDNKSNIKEQLLKEIQELLLIKKPESGFSKYDEIRAKIKDKRDLINTSKVQIAQINYEIESLKKSKHNFNNNPNSQCPVCSSKLFNINNNLIAEKDVLESNLIKQKANNEIDIKINELSNSKESLLKVVSQEKDIDILETKVRKKESDENNEYNNAQITISQKKSELSILESSIKDLDEKIKNNDEKLNKIKELEQKIKETTVLYDDNTNHLTLLESLSLIFSSKGAPSYIMEDFVDSFNEAIQDNITCIWSSASYILQTFKVNKDGKTTAKFSDQLIIDSNERSVGSLSGGEYKSLSLAVDFAILDILEKKFNMRMSPIILDEPFDAIDSIGREIIMNLLDNLSSKRQIWVVDHYSETKAVFSDIVKVEKRNGISTLASK